ncbi:MAG: ABC transporter substrate-binding protein [Spirochaetales bacterium]|nr:ABC transporter substrate-binding protein [Spirochaetales bacterium]
MNKLFVRLTILVVLLLSGAMLFATGSTEEAAPETGALSAVDPSGQTITFWHQHSREREEGMAAMVERFNATNEWGITVEAEYAGGYTDIYNKMVTAIAGNQVPDLVVGYQNESAAYEYAGALTDLTDYVSDPEWGVDDPSDFFEGFFYQDVNTQFGGKRLGFPPNRSIEVMYYNLSWLQRLGYDGPPETWDEFAAMCEAATDVEAGTYGYAISTDASRFFATVISRGGEIAKADGSGYQFTTPEATAAMEFMKDLYDKGYARKIAERYGDQTDFGNQKVLFTIGSSSGLPYYGMAVEAGEAGAFEWNVAPPPHTTSRAAVNVYGASVSVPLTTPERQLAAWLFVRWFTEPAQQAEWVGISNYFPVRYSVAANLGDYFAENPRYEDAFNILQTSDTKAEPPFLGYSEVRDMVNSAYMAIIDGEDVDEALADLEEEANEIHAISVP